ncbi:MAG: preprotein translocase subunit SecG [Eubacteriales bacterium]|nr:preprotein translocase subunit SecG [Eubacteriales bacterium]
MVLNVLGVIQVVSCLILILTILLQKGASQGLSGAISGGADTFYGKNKNTGIDAILAKITTFFCVIFVILSLILCVLS